MFVCLFWLCECNELFLVCIDECVCGWDGCDWLPFCDDKKGERTGLIDDVGYVGLIDGLIKFGFADGLCRAPFFE